MFHCLKNKSLGVLITPAIIIGILLSLLSWDALDLLHTTVKQKCKASISLGTSLAENSTEDEHGGDEKGKINFLTFQPLAFILPAPTSIIPSLIIIFPGKKTFLLFRHLRI